MVDPREVALLETDPPSLASPEDAAAETVTIDRYEADEIRLNVHAQADGLLVMSETYDPGWKATVDGEEVDILIADHALRAVPVPAGTHTVMLRHQPASLTAGLAISLGTIALLLVAGLALLRGERPAGGSLPSSRLSTGELPQRQSMP
jgi:hypothetical protein